MQLKINQLSKLKSFLKLQYFFVFINLVLFVFFVSQAWDACRAALVLVFSGHNELIMSNCTNIGTHKLSDVRTKGRHKPRKNIARIINFS